MAGENEGLEEMKVFKCPDCGGDGKRIVDWNAFNQLGTPIGFSEKAAQRQRQWYSQAYGDCHRCEGKGFILEPKTVRDLNCSSLFYFRKHGILKL